MGPAGNGGVATSVGPDQLSLREWADRAAAKVVEDYDPQAIYLFGSVARGDDHQGSDIDLLIVFDDKASIPSGSDVYRSASAPGNRDVIVTDLASFHQDKLRLWHVAHQAATEGILLYWREPRIEKEKYMNPPPPDDIMDAERLMDLVRRDLRGAEWFVGDGDEGNARYHAQQAAEKALKALLIVEKGCYPFTHNLVELVNALPEKDGDLFDVAGLDLLSPWEVKGRYLANMPDVADMPTDYFVEVAKSTVDTVENLISSSRLQREAATPKPSPGPQIVPDTAPPRPAPRLEL